MKWFQCYNMSNSIAKTVSIYNAVFPLVSIGNKSITSPVATNIAALANTGPSGVLFALLYMAMTGAKMPATREAAAANASPVPRCGVC